MINIIWIIGFNFLQLMEEREENKKGNIFPEYKKSRIQKQT